MTEDKKLKIGRAKRKTVHTSKFILKLIVCLLAAIILAIVGSCAAFYIGHQNTVSSASERAEAYGIYHMETANDGTPVNVIQFGNKEAPVTYVLITDIGVQDASVYMASSMPEITNYSILMIERPGYGYSGSWGEVKKTDQIVEIYREFLGRENNGGMTVLLAQGYGCIYANAWASDYPDEIDGIVYLDMPAAEDNTPEEQPLTIQERLYAFLSGAGLGKILPDYDPEDHAPAISLNAEEIQYVKDINGAKGNSAQIRWEQKNAKTLHENTLSYAMSNSEFLKIPKLYVAGESGFTNEEDVVRYFEYVNHKASTAGLPDHYILADNGDEVLATARQIVAESEVKFAETAMIAEELGECLVTKMPGTCRIYEQDADGFFLMLDGFTAYLQTGNPDSVAEYYNHADPVAWKAFYDMIHLDKPET